MMDRDGVQSIDIMASDKETYYKMLNAIQKFNREEFRVYASVAEDTVMIDKVVVDDDNEDHSDYDDEEETSGNENAEEDDSDEE